jgi:hypothetical protein
MRNRFILPCLAACAILALFGCVKDGYEGPSLNELFGEFEIIDSLTLSTTSPDFSIDEAVEFSATFNKPVNWQLEIQGLSSGSSKAFSGFSQALDNGAVVWTGTSSSLPFFELEDCAVALSIANEGVVLHDTLTITGLANFEGIRVADFDAGLPEGALVWRQDGGNMTFQLADDNPLLGTGYFKMGGKVGWDWSLGYIDIPVDFSDATVAASEFYLNLGVLSGTVGIPATDQFLNVSISESDGPFDDNQANNGADVFGAGNEVYRHQIRPIDWNGWEFITVPYADFEVKHEGGDNIRTPGDITAIRIACQACPFNASAACPENADRDVQTDVDFLIFTEFTDLFGQE